jgi:hypothetical protein
MFRQVALVSFIVIAAGVVLQKFLAPGPGLQRSILSELAPRLSLNASIVLPDSVEFRNATRR